MKRPTIVDVARKSGVAKSTVSVVLNETPAAGRVPEETRQRVRDAAGELGYRASWRARVLTARKTQMVGVLYTPPMPLIARGNYEGILSGINDVLQGRGYHLLLMPLGDNPAEWSKVLREERIDGAIVLSRLVPELGELLLTSGTPLALVNADSALQVSQVKADEFGGAKAALDYLFSLGHRRIDFLVGQHPHHYSMDERLRAYQDGMRAAGLAAHIRVTDKGDAGDFATFVAGADRATRPTAVICYTHYLAIKLLQELWSRGLSVPGDLSVTCFSNAYPVADTIPPLTTVALPAEDMGRKAAELILEQIDGGPAGAPRRRVVMQTSLIVRKSVEPPRP